MSKIKKAKRMFVMAEIETTLTAKELRTALAEHLTGHGAHVEKFTTEQDGGDTYPAAIQLLQVDVSVARPRPRIEP